MEGIVTLCLPQPDAAQNHLGHAQHARRGRAGLRANGELPPAGGPVGRSVSLCLEGWVVAGLGPAPGIWVTVETDPLVTTNMGWNFSVCSKA